MSLTTVLGNLPTQAEVERLFTFLGIVLVAYKSFRNARRLENATAVLNETKQNVQHIAISIDGRMEAMLKLAAENAVLAAIHGEAVGNIAGRKAERADAAVELATRTGAALAAHNKPGNNHEPVDVHITDISERAAEAIRPLAKKAEQEKGRPS